MTITSFFRHVFVVFIFLLSLQAAFAQTDTIDQRHQPLNTRLLRPGLRQYLVYYQFPSQPKIMAFSLWTRDISQSRRGGHPVFEIRQTWYSADSNHYRSVYSVNSASDFSPLYHTETTGPKLKAYNWSADGIKGADTVANNTAAGYTLDFNGPNYNWNLDIETFEMLPLAAGKTFAIRFYDAGLEPPAYVNYTVAGSEMLTTLDNKKVDCWKLHTEGTSPRGKYTQTFWISKNGHELLKEEDSFNGMFRYKVKLPGLAPNPKNLEISKF
ncbi:hypothetical protein [Chitinophaga sp. HK235]|uniref:DUF3108 domain-containing protein n=1 Tax=Chitinophaga sp. HK235 TaxID=2952571 RepID=UPI001BA939BE|nr:hypothetical protein [Chitinophaga sp. HK235]